MFKYGQVKFLSIFLCATSILLLYPAQCHAKWTVMVYMAADNNLDDIRGNPFLKDINEMEIGIDTTAVQLIVLGDRCSYGDKLGEENTYIYNITNDTVTTITYPYSGDYAYTGIASSTKSVSNLLPSTTTNELNMGDPANLVVFSTWAAKKYQADNYMLILWDHGSGWLPTMASHLKKSIAFDNTSNDFLTMDEMSSALESITSAIGRKIDIIGFDACLMAQIEVAYQIKDYANYMIASEEKEPDSGWPYDKILSQFTGNGNISPIDLSKNIVNVTDVYTISAIDLNKISNIKNSVINFADGLISIRKMPTIYNELNTSVLQTVDYFGMGNNDIYGGVDLYDLTYKIENSTAIGYMGLKTAAASVERAVNDCVIANSTGSNHSNSHGISINFPKSYESWFEKNNPDDYYSQLKFAKETNWNYFLNNFYNTSVYTPNTLFYVVSAPNPYNPNAGRLAVRNFPENSHIELKIYALDGSIVRSLETNGEMIEWDGRNESGSAVASGIYFYTAKTAAGTAKGKITVVKK